MENNFENKQEEIIAEEENKNLIQEEIQGENQQVKKKKFDFLNVILVVLLVVFLFTMGKRIFFEDVLVKKNSMTPTVLDGSVVTIYKTKEVDRFDIIVFQDKEVYSEVLIKRVIGVAGDEISIGEDGVLRVKNDVEGEKTYKEYYINYGENIVLPPTKIQEGQLFVLGDNRIISHDSSEFGAISESSVWGKVVRVKNKQ